MRNRDSTATLVDIALCIHTKLNIGIFAMGFDQTSGADFKNQCGRLAAGLQMMAITLTTIDIPS
jgi:hypothetical protein